MIEVVVNLTVIVGQALKYSWTFKALGSSFSSSKRPFFMVFEQIREGNKCEFSHLLLGLPPHNCLPAIPSSRKAAR